ncbi:MAG: protein O-mannosyl-transferase family [Anaerolineales bacterium]
MLKRHSWFLIGLGALAIIYGLSLQTIPNGSSHPYMIDVGETQVALHVWGVLHPTGYPLYTVLGNLFTPLPVLLGINPAASTSLFSTLWTLLALVGVYALLYRTTDRPFMAASGIFWLGLAQSIWMHSVVAEVYSLSLAILVALWWVALVPRLSLRERVLWLAFLGGVGVAHHRALAFTAPALLWAIWPQLRALDWRRWPSLVMGGLLLGLLGFAPYLYVLLRAWASAEWLYADDLATWDGFWFFFWGREADYLVTTPDTLAGWGENLRGTLDILQREITLPGLLVGVACLLYASWRGDGRRVAQVAGLSALGYFAFAVSYHRAVLPEAILMMCLPSLAIGVALTLARVREWSRAWGYVTATASIAWGLLLIPIHIDFIEALTTDETGLRSIAAARNVPRNALEEPVFMLSWGPRYFAASYSRLVTADNADLRMVDHRADFSALAAQGATFYTEPDTLFGYPLGWWQARIGQVYLTSAGPNLVRLGTAPRLVEDLPAAERQTYITDGIWLAGTQLRCTADDIILSVGWYARQAPSRDLSVKVHLARAGDERPLAQADARAPVHGWRPTSTWLADELVTDHYQLPRLPGGEQIILGMYEQQADGRFANYGDTPISLTGCD